MRDTINLYESRQTDRERERHTHTSVKESNCTTHYKGATRNKSDSFAWVF